MLLLINEMTHDFSYNDEIKRTMDKLTSLKWLSRLEKTSAGAVCLAWSVFNFLINSVREGFIRKKKKVVNFHNFGPDPPP